MKNIIYIVIILLGLGSCSIQENIHFNKDFSGTASYVIDFTAMMEMIPEDSLKNLDDAEIAIAFEEAEQLYDEIDGISNFTYEVDVHSGNVSYSFDFDHLDALNATFDIDQMDEEMLFSDSPVVKHFSGKKNKLTVELILDKNHMESMDEMAEMMFPMFDIEQHYTFDNKVKKLKTKNLDFEMGEDENSVTMDGNLGDLISDEKGTRKCIIILNKK